MKSLRRFLVLNVLGLALPAGPLLAATTPAGHWEGNVTLPGTALAIRVDLENAKTGAWVGTIDIPVQGLRGFKLGEVSVKADAVSFTLPGIPGDPKFAGKLAADAGTISGDLTQNGQTFPFKLERKAKSASTMGETPGKGVPGKGLVGYWQASLKPSPGIELRLVLEVTNTPASQLAGVMVSVDQGNVRIPVTGLTEKSGAVHIEVASVGGTFDGKLSADGSEISGDWKQGGGTLPLAFKRLEKAPKFARPQDPTKPHPYDEEEVAFENPAAGIKLAASVSSVTAKAGSSRRWRFG